MISKIQKCQHTQLLLMTQIRNILFRVLSRKHSVFKLASRKTEISKSASEPKLQGLLAEEALAMLYVLQKSSLT